MSSTGRTTTGRIARNPQKIGTAMRPHRTALAGLASRLASTAAAHKDGLKVIAGVDAVSGHVADGASQTDGKPAIQPYIEPTLRGF
ncbi:hypothetical protein SAMN05216236_101112 [Sedimentitalea nanhaiensis]|uniref:Uncharacterized protein n=2 Tax=Sedimentitalea nanhaiensis TaxID=999627 RepID=A0A1I6X7D3_9RHOB|nr:hypothetical protein SAMN05216236_101112 [Sedimentitalea nanhaiensis]